MFIQMKLIHRSLLGLLVCLALGVANVDAQPPEIHGSFDPSLAEDFTLRVHEFPSTAQLGGPVEIRLEIVYTGTESFVNQALLREEEFGIICLTDNLIDHVFEKGPVLLKQEEFAAQRAAGKYSGWNPIRAKPRQVKSIYTPDDVTSSTVVQEWTRSLMVRQMPSMEDSSDEWARDMYRRQLEEHTFYAGRREMILDLSDYLIPTQSGTYHFAVVYYLYGSRDFSRPVPVVSNSFTIRFDPPE